MFNRIIDCVVHLCNALTSGHSTSTDLKLDSIAEKLEKIERGLKKQRQFAVFTFMIMLGLATIAIGLGIRHEQPDDGLLLLILGLGLMLVACIGGVFISLRK